MFEVIVGLSHCDVWPCMSPQEWLSESAVWQESLLLQYREQPGLDSTLEHVRLGVAKRGLQSQVGPGTIGALIQSASKSIG